MNSTAKKIRETRQLRGLTQEELAEKAKINLRTVQRIENSENEPRGKTLSLICEVLELDLNEEQINSKALKLNSLLKTILNSAFLVVLNLILMGIIGFLTLDSNANFNSLIGGYLISILLPLFLVLVSKNTNPLLRILKFGIGYILYFVLVCINLGFQTGFVSGLFPCLFISLSILYFGERLIEGFRQRCSL